MPASGNPDPINALRLLVPLVVAGAIAAKVALDWVGGRRSGRDPDVYGGTGDWSDGHDGCSADHGGGCDDGGHS